MWKPPNDGNFAKHSVTTHLNKEDHDELVKLSISTNNKISAIVRSMIVYCLNEREDK